MNTKKSVTFKAIVARATFELLKYSEPKHLNDLTIKCALEERGSIAHHAILQLGGEELYHKLIEAIEVKCVCSNENYASANSEQLTPILEGLMARLARRFPNSEQLTSLHLLIHTAEQSWSITSSVLHKAGITISDLELVSQRLTRPRASHPNTTQFKTVEQSVVNLEDLLRDKKRSS